MRLVLIVIGILFASSLSGQQLIPPDFWNGPITQPDGFSPTVVFQPFAEAAGTLRWLFVMLAVFPLWLAWSYRMNNAQSAHDMNQAVIVVVLSAMFASIVPLATSTLNENFIDPVSKLTREGATRVQMISRIWEMSNAFTTFEMSKPTEEEQKQIKEATDEYLAAKAKYDAAQDENLKKAAAKEVEGKLARLKQWFGGLGSAVKKEVQDVVSAVIDPAQEWALKHFFWWMHRIFVWIAAFLLTVMMAMMWFVASVMEMVRYALIIGMSIMLPFFIGCLPNRVMSGHGRTFVLQYIGVCLWPIGFAIVDMGTMKLFEGFLIIMVEPMFASAKFAAGLESTWSLSEEILSGRNPVGVQISFAEGSDLAKMATQYGVPLPAPFAAELLALKCWMDSAVYVKGITWCMLLFAWVFCGTIGVPVAMIKLASSGASMFLSTAQTATDMATAFGKEKLNAMLRSGGGGGGATPPLTPQAIGKAVADAMRGGGGSGGGGPSDVGGSDLPPSTPPSGGGDIPDVGGSSGGSSGGSGGGSSGGAGGSVPPFLATPVAVASAADKVAASGVRATGNAVSSGMDKVGDAISSEQSGSTGGGKGSQDFWTKSYQSAYGSSSSSGSGSGDDAGVSGGAVGESQTTARRRVHVRTERDDDGDGGAVTSALRSGSESSQQTRRAHVSTVMSDDGIPVIRRGVSDSSASSQSESIIRRGR